MARLIVYFHFDQKFDLNQHLDSFTWVKFLHGMVLVLAPQLSSQHYYPKLSQDNLPYRW